MSWKTCSWLTVTRVLRTYDVHNKFLVMSVQCSMFVVKSNWKVLYEEPVCPIEVLREELSKTTDVCQLLKKAGNNWMWCSRSSMRSHWRVTRMRWRPVRRCVCHSYDARDVLNLWGAWPRSVIVHYWVPICWSFRCTLDSSVKAETVDQPISCYYKPYRPLCLEVTYSTSLPVIRVVVVGYDEEMEVILSDDLSYT